MLEAILDGLFLGLVLSFLTGPIFFLLMETSIRRGIRAALIFDFGVLVSDIVFIGIAVIFYHQFSDLAKHENTLAIIGGAIFIVFGLYNIFKHGRKAQKETDPLQSVPNTNMLKQFLKGFILNIMNPAVLFYWFSVLILARVKNQFSDTLIITYFVSILISFFSIDVLKIFGAAQLKKVITPAILHKVNVVTGFIMILFGVAMFIKSTGLLD